MSFLVAVLMGLGMGILTGMGVGGGKLLTPALVLYFGLRQQVAQGITLTAFLPIAAMASWVHVREHNVDFGLGWRIVLGSVAGAIAGAAAAAAVPSELLQKIYGFFLLGIGIYEIISAQRIPTGTEV